MSGRHWPPGREDGHAPRFEPIPKPGGGVRWLTRLDPAGEAAYRAAVRPLAGRIERILGPEVLASRTRPSPGGWRLAPWGPARAAWARAIRAALAETRREPAFAVADVRDCYGSITPETVEAVLGPEAARAAGFLRWLRDLGVRGLPVGPEPSAVLANAILARLDRALRTSEVRHVRWVDDLVLWGEPREVRRAMSSLRRQAATLGLDLHDGKTRLLADRREARAVALGERDSSIIAAP
jgi:hypothetical protein